MNHDESLKLGAAEKYVLRELPDELRDAFEDHFFECHDCAADIRALASFAEAGPEAYDRDGCPEPISVPASKPSVWAWLRPPIAVPAFSALLFVVGYQNLSTIPELRKSAAVAQVQVLKSFPLAKANTRGSSALNIPVQPGESFTLKFDIPPSKGFAQYLCQLQDASGRVLHQVNVDVKRANKGVELFVPAGMINPGTYYVVITGEPVEHTEIATDERVADLGFQIQFEN